MSDEHVMSVNLTDNEKRFIMTYVLNFNIKETASIIGLSPSTCRSYLKKPEVEKEVNHFRTTIAEKCGVTMERVLNELSRIAFYDIGDHVEQITDSGVTFKDFDEMDTRVLSEVTTNSTSDGMTYTTIKTPPKIKALEILANIFKGQPAEQHVHFHVTKEELDNKTAAEAAQDYNSLLNL